MTVRLGFCLQTAINNARNAKSVVMRDCIDQPITRLESGQRRVDIVELIELSEIIGFDINAMVDAVQQVRDKTK